MKSRAGGNPSAQSKLQAGLRLCHIGAHLSHPANQMATTYHVLFAN